MMRVLFLTPATGRDITATSVPSDEVYGGTDVLTYKG
jgi:hypothetical protein